MSGTGEFQLGEATFSRFELAVGVGAAMLPLHDLGPSTIPFVAGVDVTGRAQLAMSDLGAADGLLAIEGGFARATQTGSSNGSDGRRYQFDRRSTAWRVAALYGPDFLSVGPSRNEPDDDGEATQSSRFGEVSARLLFGLGGGVITLAEFDSPIEGYS